MSKRAGSPEPFSPLPEARAANPTRASQGSSASSVRSLALVAFSTLLTGSSLVGQPSLDAHGVFLEEPVVPEPFAKFGLASTAGDFNDDGWGDFAVGSPSHLDLSGTVQDAGLVHVYFGNALGFGYASSVGGDTEDASLGISLATGRFDDTEIDQVLIGASGLAVGGAPAGAGAVRVATHSPTAGGVELTSTILVAPNPQAEEHFGQAVAVGDFNGDGYDDAAIGIPYHDVTIPTPPPLTSVDAGAVAISYGSAAGLQAILPAFVYTREHFAALSSQASERMGFSLAAGDFNGDGWDDLAIGSPQRDVGGVADVGEVLLMEGSMFGLFPTNTVLRLADFDPGLAGIPAWFGRALATGDFDRAICVFLLTPCRDDLAIGAPVLPVGNPGGQGAVAVARGTASGLVATTRVVVRADLPGNHQLSASEGFGEALSAANFGGAPAGDDLAIAVPGAQVGSTSEQGAVYVVHGSANLLNESTATIAVLQSAPVTTGQNYGETLSSVDLDGNGHRDLIVGVPFYLGSGGVAAGAVEVLLRGPFFADGFESGDTNAWSAASP